MPGIDSPPDPEQPRPERPACGHIPGSQGTVVEAVQPGGDISDNPQAFIVCSLLGGSQELTSLRCPQCRRNTTYRHRTRTAGAAADIGSDPEVIGDALNTLLDQSDVNIFSLVVTGDPDLTSYVLPRHHLPAFRITDDNS